MAKGAILGKAPTAAECNLAENLAKTGSVLGVAVSAYVRDGLYLVLELTDGKNVPTLYSEMTTRNWEVLSYSAARPTKAEIAASSTDVLFVYALGRIDQAGGF